MAASALLTVAGLRLRTVCRWLAVVAHRPVTRVTGIQHVAFGVGVGEPREVLADLRRVGAARLIGTAARRAVRGVLLKDRCERLDQVDGGAAAARRRILGPVSDLKRIRGCGRRENSRSL
jgi:hypothetical protein